MGHSLLTEQTFARRGAVRARRMAATWVLPFLALPTLAYPQAISQSAGAPPPAPPGLFSLGPFYLTPTFHIGALGLDTNVFYTPTQRQADFTTTGGPGLEVVLPVGSSVQLFADGDINYVYYLRTTSQRRFGGDAKGGGEYKGDHLKVKIEDSYTRSFQRPNFQVDERILINEHDLRGDIVANLGARLTSEATVTYSTTRVDPGQVFDGTDLRLTMSRNETLSLLQFGYGVTSKTSVILGGDYEIDRFPFEADRNADSDHLFGGLEVKSDTRLSGRAVGGVRLFRPMESSVQIQAPYADVALAYAASSHTELKASYVQDLAFSVFNTSGLTPTIKTQNLGGSLDLGFGSSGLDLLLSGARSTFTTDGTVTVVFGPTDVETAVRTDHIWQAGANFGYRFRSRLRVGVAANYVSRQSTFADFGISGLVVGATATFDPNHQ